MHGKAVALVLLVACATSPALAQRYAPTPIPRTKNAVALGALARDREIHERFSRGVAAEERGDWDAAAVEFRRIITLDVPEPRGSTARYDLALAEAMRGRDGEAVSLLEDALHRDPHFAAAAANLVALQLRRGDLPAARDAANRFVGIAPDAARALYGRGLAALRAGDLAMARNAFRVLAERNPAYAVAHYDLAIVELRAGRDESARTELERALELSPGYARARFALGTVLLRSGRRDDARAAFDRCAHDAEDPALRALAMELRARI
jgi:tetratricopeptide (TPR) repeat protein